MNVENVGNVWVEQWGRREQRGSKMDGKPNKATEENDWGRGRGMEGMCSEVWSRKQWNFVTLMHTHSTMLAKFKDKFSSFPLSLTLSHTHRYTVTLSKPHSHIVFCLAFAGTWLPFPSYFCLMSNYFDSTLQIHSPQRVHVFHHISVWTVQDLKQLVLNLFDGDQLVKWRPISNVLYIS